MVKQPAFPSLGAGGAELEVELVLELLSTVEDGDGETDESEDCAL
jgi:hypothetical protein